MHTFAMTLDGQILQYDANQEVVGIYFGPNHYLHDVVIFQLVFQSKDVQMQTFFEETQLVGEIHLFENGKHCMTMFAQGHKYEREIHHYKSDKLCVRQSRIN